MALSVFKKIGRGGAIINSVALALGQIRGKRQLSMVEMLVLGMLRTHMHIDTHIHAERENIFLGCPQSGCGDNILATAPSDAIHLAQTLTRIK